MLPDSISWKKYNSCIPLESFIITATEKQHFAKLLHPPKRQYCKKLVTVLSTSTSITTSSEANFYTIYLAFITYSSFNKARLKKSGL